MEPVARTDPPIPGTGLARRRRGSANSAPVGAAPTGTATGGREAAVPSAGRVTVRGGAGATAGGTAIGAVTTRAGAGDVDAAGAGLTDADAGFAATDAAFPAVGDATTGAERTDFGPGLRGERARSSPHDGQRAVPSALYRSQPPQTMPISSSIGSLGRLADLRPAARDDQGRVTRGW